MTYTTYMTYKTYKTYKSYKPFRACLILLAGLLLTLLPLPTAAQIVIGGNVYGGGNIGATDGNTSVTVYSGNLNGVYGGARQADIMGHTLVNVDGEHASDYILINNVFGGNDITGTIEGNATLRGAANTLPSVIDADSAKAYGITTDPNSLTTDWTTFVHTSPSASKKMFIGRIFGGSNGEYDYDTEPTAAQTTTDPETGAVTVVTPAVENPYYNLARPNVAKTYLELLGGTIAHAYGGGNAATVTGNASIYINNTSTLVTTSIKVGNWELLNTNRLDSMGLNPYQTHLSSTDYQFGRVFGGNNKETMAIRPRWHLWGGKIRDLYSGGNEGHMTSAEGLLLTIPAESRLKAYNVFGGCRRSDVRPLDINGRDMPNEAIQLPAAENAAKIPAGFAARVRVLGGDITNVYGGNDISGNVYAGNTVGISTTIHGNVFGGGNGSYVYTDNKTKMDSTDPADAEWQKKWHDFYYDPGTNSVEALNAFRPNAEQVSIHIFGTQNNPTFIKGALYVGSNSASLAELTTISNRKVELKIGSYVMVDTVFLGNNGINMIDASDNGILAQYADRTVSSLDLTQPDIFAKYMEGCAMRIVPSVTFDNTNNGDALNYDPYTTTFGSFYCGGNVGSMLLTGLTTIDFDHEVIIYDKFVGGCNNANVPEQFAKVGNNTVAQKVNARYEGGFMTPDSSGPTVGATTPIADKLVLNLGRLKIKPMRWKTKNADGTDYTGTPVLEWNTYDVRNNLPVIAPTALPAADANGQHISTDNDKNRRLRGGNIYGGCYTSGHIDGNVVINLNGTIHDRFSIFDETEQDEGEAKLYGNSSYNITKRNSGVILDEQGMDVLGKSLNVFGGGKGAETEIWGSTTINLKKGYTFQIFGGSEEGAIGRGTWDATTNKYVYAATYDPRFSTYINLDGPIVGVRRGGTGDSKDMASSEFIYGGGFEGPIIGDTHLYLGNGRIFNSFAGSCNADIWGHTETYVGLNIDGELGFPWVRDHIYGGNDLGGSIKGEKDFSDRLSDFMQAHADSIHGRSNNSLASTTASAYTEYRQGRVENIFGGCYGDYDYTDRLFSAYTYADGRSKEGFTKPRMNSTFVNFRPESYAANTVNRVYGAGQGHAKGIGVDSLQNSSYVLIDIPQTTALEHNFESMAVFGSGSWCGLGMRVDSATVAAAPDKYSAIIDLFRGNIGNAYGGSFNEGFTRRAIVNVPRSSTVHVKSLFGGAYGSDPLYPCDVYEAQVNYDSENALVQGNIYGGNNNADRTLYGQVNITVPVWQNKSKGYLATVYGAGYGEGTWSQYTEVNLLEGAHVYEVYGGGHNGRVYNIESLLMWQAIDPSLDLSMGDYTECGLEHKTLVHATRLGGKYNTNVHIYQGAVVEGYAYGGGMGDSTKVRRGILGSGDIYGTTYIDLLGGTVKKDMYAAGTSGAVRDSMSYKILYDDDLNPIDDSKVREFTATATAYVEGGSVRNVYGGGWQGSVGYHEGKISASYENDIPGETYVIIGKSDGNSFINGIPTVQRNAYGGGEGGPVYGTAHLTINKGYIGYTYNATTGQYEEKINDETWTDHIGQNRLYDSGCVFGGGYIDNSSVDDTNVTIMGGQIRNSVFGGGEIAAVGRGETNTDRSLKGLYKAGSTKVTMYDGHVDRDVFGGGRGYNNLGERGTLYSDGFVFGHTEVDIHGGEIGTDAGLALGYGNVFGGGDIGYVYSAYEYEDPTTHKMLLGRGRKSGVRYNEGLTESSVDSETNEHIWDDEGYYYQYQNGKFEKDGNEKIMTEDCKVLIEPMCLATADVTINNNIDGTITSTLFKKGTYVPITALNQLGTKSDSKWLSLDDRGIIIHNAVFAGGNTSSGSDQVFANTTTVYGNATASIHDVYHRDLITLGTGHIGGLYGDGNLTFVDGYRGLNITNYGTDYYSITHEISYDTYLGLPDREKAYYELRYRCVQQITDKEGKTYSVGSTITTDELLVLFKDWTYNGETILSANGKPATTNYWVENGVCSRYAGRLMNSIQRADFCGVFGSRMVMQGAQDRVPEIVDYTNYTINRVREVSLNKKMSEITADANDAQKKMHGNYFGIYNIVNYLGALTSDFDFGDDSNRGDIRTTDNENTSMYGATGGDFYQWKKANYNQQKRNNGNSHNQVALASGVYLELTTEKSTGTGLHQKDWGLITGVVELDLINVQTGIGGGFVYARNEHGVRSKTNKHHVTLTKLNQGAVTSDDYTYTTADDTKKDWQTSGNFVHSTQIIIDDCYDISGKFKGNDAVPAHYWYIKGNVYVYDQYISAYTGAPNAYSETVNIPLTITAASNGTMRLLNVQSNRFAYYATNTSGNQVPLGDGKELVLNDVTYQQNTPISYWDWFMLSRAEKNLFVNETYVVTSDCKIGTTEYKAGQVLLPDAYNTLRTSGDNDSKPVVTQKKTIGGVEQDVEVDFDFVFRSSNNMSHQTGYILTYEVNNPLEWNKWYTRINDVKKTTDGNDTYTYVKIPTDTYDSYETDNDATTNQSDFTNGPTYRLKDAESGGVFGQREYKIGNLIDNGVYTTYQDIVTNHSSAVPADQATFYPAYIVTKEMDGIHLNDANSTEQHLYPNATVAKELYSTLQWTAMSPNVAPAYICTSTIQLNATEYIYAGTVMTETEKNNFRSQYTDLASEINEKVVKAYYCTEEGSYGGDYYAPNVNYRGLVAWCSLSDADRNHFEFNYDALDLLVDPTYGGVEGKKYQYDGYPTDYTPEVDDMVYSLTRPVDYTATYHGKNAEDTAPLKYTDAAGVEQSVDVNQELSRAKFDAIPNERRHYSSFKVSEVGKLINGYYYVYVANTPFQVGETPYALGQTVKPDAYNNLSDDDPDNNVVGDKNKVTVLKFPESDKDNTFYFCRESYQIGHLGEGHEVAVYDGVTGGNTTGATNGKYTGNGTTVPIGVVINEDSFKELTNKQLNFTIHGKAPIETSTLYVSRNSDIFDLSTEKIITVIYQYDYEESDADGMHITPVSERHVLNIHIVFKSGIPTVEDISAPKIVLPGTTVGMREPHVTPGAYEVTGGGWELFEKESDAESHSNGIEITPSTNPLYWYQNGYYLSYYALTYLGKTYSNHVQVSVANYHDLAEVMGDKNHHYYIDHKNVQREPKIYINDYTRLDNPKNGLDLFRNLIDLSYKPLTYDANGNPIPFNDPDDANNPLNGHVPLDNTHATKPMQGGQYLEFFVRANQDHGPTTEPDPDHEGETITVPHPWTPIANNDDQCFSGRLHGDGYTFSGLDHSLFNHLCGEVFNLGVTGTFTGAGIAETGGGYVENCWTYTTNTAAKTSLPVFGNPSRVAGDSKGLIQLVNCYYLENDNATNKYTPHSGDHGTATRKTDQAFYNGEVTFDLNGFYLNKRYWDAPSVASALAANNRSSYFFLPANSDGTLPDAQVQAYYPTTHDAQYGDLGYVEERFADGDFIYAGGNIPDDINIRMRQDADGVERYYPIWPDDYLFFGQMLTYGYEDSRPHQPLPAHINKSGGQLTTDATSINRVHRAPAYFRSNVMGVAHYNPYAVFAAQSADGKYAVYPNMTAIDFTGYQDGAYTLGLGNAGSGTNNAFYPPLLDNSGLTRFRNIDLTKNLLAYIPEATTKETDADTKTYLAVNTALDEPEYTEEDPNYRTVAIQPTAHIYGHPVVQTGVNEYTAQKDHLLVDLHDFYAPISYTFDSSHRMFYQRTPERYVSTSWSDDATPVRSTTGWEAVSLPFSAELVTTQNKGEITHFYGGSDESANGTGTKIGHEYWLREFRDGGTTTANIFEAKFLFPDAITGGTDKEYNNTYLWDHYYSASLRQDANTDKYQEYYRYGRTHKNYAYTAPAMPYIIGFPGNTFFEFDLSGNFEPLNTLSPIGKINQQVITFASNPGITIASSYEELTASANNNKNDGYIFKANYLRETFPAGTTGTYTLNDEGNSFDIIPAAAGTGEPPVAPVVVQPFRPFFIKAPSQSRKTDQTERIIIGGSTGIDDLMPHGDQPDGNLLITAKRGKIVVSSTLSHPQEVIITNVGGIHVAVFTIEPGQTIETPISQGGVYIVNQRKVAVSGPR